MALLVFRALGAMTKGRGRGRHVAPLPPLPLPSRIGVQQQAHTAPHRASGGVRGA